MRIEQYEGVSAENINEFLLNVDMLCDAMDYFVIEPRILMYKRARELLIPTVMSCPIGFGGTMHHFSPDGMKFEDYFDLSDGMSEAKKLVNFGIGLDPGKLYRSYMDDPRLDFEARKVASLSSSCLLATTLTSTFTLAYFLNKRSFLKAVPNIYQIDYLAGKFLEIHVPEGVKGIKLGNFQIKNNEGGE